MTNDDPMYVRHLESALEAAELEIKGLEGELREQDKVLQQLHDQLLPTHMGEPLITRPKVGAGDTAVQGDMLLPANAALTGAEGVRVEGTVMQHTEEQ